jgi:peptidoglycan/xylan/chitin deacetylase (PgdA/CDA1 family)
VHLTFDDGYKNNLTELYPYLKQKNIPFTIFASINHIINNVRFDNFRIACAIKHTVQERSLDKIAKSITAAEVNRSALIHLVITHYKYLSVEIKRELLEEICQLLDEKEWVQYNEVYHSENVLSVDELKQLSADPMVHIGSHGYNHYIQTTLSEKERMFELEQSKDLLQQLLGKKISTYCYPNGGKKDFSEETEASCTKANYTHCFTTIAGSWKPDGNLMQIPRFPLTYSHLPQIAIKAPVT